MCTCTRMLLCVKKYKCVCFVYQIISYSGGSRYFHGTPTLTKGVDFAATDPSQGDASLSIDSVNEAHAGTYQCKVKKSPGVDMHKVSLVVLGKALFLCRQTMK